MSFLSNSLIYQYIKCHEEIYNLKINIATNNRNLLENEKSYLKLYAAFNKFAADFYENMDKNDFDNILAPAFCSFMSKATFGEPFELTNELYMSFRELKWTFLEIYGAHTRSSQFSLANSNDPLVCYIKNRMLSPNNTDIKLYIINSISGLVLTAFANIFGGLTDMDLKNFMRLMDIDINIEAYKICNYHS